MKKLLLLLLMLVAGIAAQATVQTSILIQGMTRTGGNTSFCVFAIQTQWGMDQTPMQPGSSYTFNNYVIRGEASVTVNGTLNFQEGTSAADVITGSSFTVTIESSTLWFYSASVNTKSGTVVSGCTTEVSSDKHTLTVTIPSGKTFGSITVDYVPNEPLSSSNTVISGIENEYIYNGSPVKPVPTVTYNGTVLTEGTDYTYYINGGDGVGGATVFVEGAGEYAGRTHKSYTVRNVAPSDFNSLGNNTYEIASTEDLDRLAMLVNIAANTCNGLTFKQTANIAYDYTTQWEQGGENNFTAIGGVSKPFSGTYDGQNNTISGIRILKNAEQHQGLFGYVANGGTVKNVILADASITGYVNTGGIAGVNDGGTIEDCRVESNVSVNYSGKTSSNYGGIVGKCSNRGTISRCTFSGEITVKTTLDDGISQYVGGIVGNLTSATVSNCLVLDATIISQKYIGAIVGVNSGTLAANYYHDCLVRNTERQTDSYTNVGVGKGIISEDQEGARSVHALTLPDGVTATGESVDIDGVTHYAAATTVTLSYSGEVPEGYQPIYSVNGTAIEGTAFEMLAIDVTVSILGFGLPIDSVNFPDANFRGYLLAKSYGSDGVLTDEEIAGITSISVSYKSIADLTGIEHFTALTQLYCSNNQLTSLDVSHNTALLILSCQGNQLTALNVSQNTALSQLYCYVNQLTELDVSQNTALTRLDCSDNQLTVLDVSQNTALRSLDCSLNQLTALDVSQSTALSQLYCFDNQLTELDVSHNTALVYLDCRLNQLASLDVSQNTALTQLNCSENRIKGESMEALVASLPTVDVDDWVQCGEFRVINLLPETDQNVITTTQVATARAKNWSVLGWTGDYWKDYDGSEPSTGTPGDLNGDGNVDVLDVNIVINLVLGRVAAAEVTGNPDLDGNGAIDVVDVNALINLILQ